ncbi:MAG: hypothetical protein NZM07_02845, partial [Elioraea sp.]|nr:hypothetical protein [Elioraea sp.]
PQPAAPLGPSRGIVLRLAALFSLDAFAGGLVVQSLLALWLFERFELSLAATGQFFFASGLLAWPLALCRALKIAYDLMLFAAFRGLKPPEERTPR